MRIFSKFLLVQLLLGICYAHSSFGQREYLDEVFKIIEQNSIRRDSVDFERIKRIAYGKLDNAKSIGECYPIVRAILVELNDHHSFFIDRDEVDRWKSTNKIKSITESPPFSGKVLHKDIGYIRMQGFSSGDSISMLEYSNSLQNLIRSIDNSSIKGWILDVRENTGGNCWPMLTGLGPLLGNGICGFFVDNNHNKVSWHYQDGIAGENSIEICRLGMEPYKLLKSNNPIAVLTGSRTASSGEVVVTAFRGKVNARGFGESTAGLSTGNANFTLSDGSMILLTTSIYADRQGNIYGGKIAPDTFIKFDYNELETDTDSVIKSAINWIYKDR